MAKFAREIDAEILQTMSVLSVVVAIAARCIASEALVSRIIHIHLLKDHLTELGITIAFIVLANSSNLYFGFICYSLIAIVYVFFNRQSIGSKLKKMRKNNAAE
jgi:hypothetical protein